jgi:hypothetical protein
MTISKWTDFIVGLRWESRADFLYIDFKMSLQGNVWWQIDYFMCVGS